MIRATRFHNRAQRIRATRLNFSCLDGLELFDVGIVLFVCLALHSTSSPLARRVSRSAVT